MKIIKKYEMFGGRMLSVLEAIENGALEMIDIFMAASTAETGYGASQARMNRAIRRRGEERNNQRIDARERHALSSLISKLKKQGFIQSSSSRNRWRITTAGKEKIKSLTARLFKNKLYLKEPDTRTTIVAFDIPEKQRGDRAWIRLVLQRLEYKPIQKSFFIGTTKIPSEFIYDLNQKNLLTYIHIFGIGNKGTLEDRLTNITKLDDRSTW